MEHYGFVSIVSVAQTTRTSGRPQSPTIAEYETQATSERNAPITCRTVLLLATVAVRPVPLPRDRPYLNSFLDFSLPAKKNIDNKDYV